MAKEKGYAHRQGHYIGRAAEDNWELQWPRSISVYSKMAREDSQVKSVLKAIIQPIIRTSWRLDPNGADTDVVRIVAEDLNLKVTGEDMGDPILRTPRRVSWGKHLRRALKMMLVYGHAYFELVWDDASEAEDGRTHLRKLAPRHPETISKINVAADGGLESIEQTGLGSGGTVTIPVENLLAYVADDDRDDWVGESMLRAAYKHWRLKDEFLRLEQVVLDRNGMGVPVMRTAPMATDEDMDRALSIVEGIRSGEHSGAAIKDGEVLEIKGVSGQLVSPREAIAYHDAQIARTALAHALNLEGKGGSYALASVQMDLFFQALNEIAQQMADTANQFLVREMAMTYAGGLDGPFPMITFDTIDARTTLTPNDLAALKNAGLIFADPRLEAHLRRSYELPPQQPYDEYRDHSGQEGGEAHAAT
ncbi:DUF935 domain-containing protein [Corynebacterium mastitidis]|uniref:DUF935 domain-containing protein n=1 Tax=Corynebacterium mastitidis TaxID=161890 RepID=A0A2N0X8V0_9CORY|nr:hypothetical protein [Corynebacterium mastitidis]MCH6197455.1 DUF935 domain-containing protein [Corynebacterium mastitidis]PKF69141.1 hypothetical protein CXB45_03075 [Corynebacterium mastitidis]